MGVLTFGSACQGGIWREHHRFKCLQGQLEALGQGGVPCLLLPSSQPVSACAGGVWGAHSCPRYSEGMEPTWAWRAEQGQLEGREEPGVPRLWEPLQVPGNCASPGFCSRTGRLSAPCGPAEPLWESLPPLPGSVPRCEVVVSGSEGCSPPS